VICGEHPLGQHRTTGDITAGTGIDEMSRRAALSRRSDSVTRAMGSLIKKRRKRMRKKKHKKMLKRTRWQRRSK
jgi:hypothetical protein